jgi:hypothetical protein
MPVQHSMTSSQICLNQSVSQSPQSLPFCLERGSGLRLTVSRQSTHPASYALIINGANHPFDVFAWTIPPLLNRITKFRFISVTTSDHITHKKPKSGRFQCDSKRALRENRSVLSYQGRCGRPPRFVVCKAELGGCSLVFLVFHPKTVLQVTSGEVGVTLASSALANTAFTASLLRA